MASYINYYRCTEDGIEWADAWSCMCNDECPGCNAETEPHRTEELAAPLAHEFSMQH